MGLRKCKQFFLMFQYIYKIRLSDTDATGVIYFTKLLEIAQNAFVEMLEEKGAFSLRHLLEEADFLLPVKHVEADYKGPIGVDDHIVAHLKITKIGNSSLEHYSELIKDGLVVGSVKMVHVKISKKTMRACPIDVRLRTLLESCMPEELRLEPL
ncbi:MAG: 1,4-dihydroxy-2-naphthoyl-CoA hydrolase [Chlamydiia bacterium]|nr:1,4-dihydroxy-2-naphthoyl-CoA hydrolase [Chlamydiia bacterium]MCH9615418.1 1,4-dihydroxy-2-naphthoyl-CoA hydrolase [Chlamydiia bacterium]MCH9628260.1 1,4-dihydroxy-2-naphthoyl-CoA hydrolase [Chlamydiia bacterium]